jgi:hypothetical protein
MQAIVGEFRRNEWKKSICCNVQLSCKYPALHTLAQKQFTLIPNCANSNAHAILKKRAYITKQPHELSQLKCTLL